MKSPPRLLPALVALVGALFGQSLIAAAQEFTNLDFENVVLNGTPTPETLFSSVDSVPGWTFSHWTPQLAPHLGGYVQQFLVNSFTAPWQTPIQGQYSLYFEEGLSADLTAVDSPWIEQTGMVPASARSLRFPDDSHSPYLEGRHPWVVSLDGVALPTKELQPPGQPFGPAIATFDLAAYAGQVHTLRIGIDPDYDVPVGGFNTAGVLDAIQFSPLDYTVLPEPGGAWLAAAALAGTTLRLRIRR
jgi:hypothetical protein